MIEIGDLNAELSIVRFLREMSDFFGELNLFDSDVASLSSTWYAYIGLKLVASTNWSVGI